MELWKSNEVCLKFYLRGMLAEKTHGAADAFSSVRVGLWEESSQIPFVIFLKTWRYCSHG
jgi:hypothetical protein